MRPSEFTYEKRLGKRNARQLPVLHGPNQGKIFEWFTVNGKVACYPDHWDNGKNRMPGLETIPDEIIEIHRIGKDSQ